MNMASKFMIMVLMILYIASPLDAYPRPIDDIFVLHIDVAAQRRMGVNRDYEEEAR